MATIFLCTACGTSFPAAPAPPSHCLICDDARQFVPADGQSWTTRDALAARHRNAWRLHEPGLLSLHTVPGFAIDQRALLLITPKGNILWDCVALLDPATEALVRGLGGLAAIAISHPHFYTTMQDWAAAFDVPVHLHAANRDWVARPSPSLHFWDDDTFEVAPAVTLIRLGGHFPGSTVLHWGATADGVGALFTGDTVQVTPGGRRVSFMWSYPNLVPLSVAEIRTLVERLAPWTYDRIYGAFPGRDVPVGGQDILVRCADFTIERLESRSPPPVP